MSSTVVRNRKSEEELGRSENFIYAFRSIGRRQKIMWSNLDSTQDF